MNYSIAESRFIGKRFS